MRIGIYGGSFNPPHIGHLIVVESVQDRLRFDTVLFIPAATPPHKIEHLLAPAQDRLEMTSLAIQRHPVFRVSDIEIRREGRSYTIDTLKQLQVLYPKAEFSLIIGADNFLEIDTWKSPDEIFQLAELIVLNRPEYSTTTQNARTMRQARFVTVPNIAISGTDIRRRIKEGRSIRYMVTKEVEEYIYSKGLYR